MTFMDFLGIIMSLQLEVAVGLGVVGLSLLILFIRWYCTRNNDFWRKQGVFEIDANKIAPYWKRMTQNIARAEYDQATYEALGDEPFGGYVEKGQPILVVRDLELLKRILVKDFDHFVDRPVASMSKHDEIYKKMLVNQVGKEWKDLRPAVTPAFSASKIRRMFQSFNARGHQMVGYMKQLESSEIDFQNLFGRYTLGVIATLAFGLEADTFRNTESTYFKMVKQMNTFSRFRIAKVVTTSYFPSIAKLLRLRLSDAQSMNFFASVVKDKMRERRETGVKRQDFLQLMLDAQHGRLKMDQREVLDVDEENAVLRGVTTNDIRYEFDDDLVLSQCLLFFFGGSDTIQALLTFAVYELARNPDVQAKLTEYVTEAMAGNNGNISYEAVQECEYLDMVVRETLRLHSPAFGTRRLCNTPYKLPGTDVILPVGCRVDISFNGIHKDPRNYPDPIEFNPENFNAENKASRNSLSWLPFGHGPRNCVAMRFALMEGKAALAHLLFNFKIEPCERTPQEINVGRWSNIRKSVDGMWLKFTPRQPCVNANG